MCRYTSLLITFSISSLCSKTIFSLSQIVLCVGILSGLSSMFSDIRMVVYVCTFFYLSGKIDYSLSLSPQVCVPILNKTERPHSRVDLLSTFVKARKV